MAAPKLWYFNQRNYRPKTKKDTDQWGSVLDFKDKLPDPGLWWQYNGKAQFKELLLTHLTNYFLNRYSLVQPAAVAHASQPADRGDYFAVQARVISEYELTFVGREIAQYEFDTFLKTQARGYFIVRGGPGQGKTALSCHLIKTRGYAHHLVSRTGGRGDTLLILRSLLSQIRLAGDDAERPESLSELTKIFEESVLAAASKQKPLLVVIDALDELPPP